MRVLCTCHEAAHTHVRDSLVRSKEVLERNQVCITANFRHVRCGVDSTVCPDATHLKCSVARGPRGANPPPLPPPPSPPPPPASSDLSAPTAAGSTTFCSTISSFFETASWHCSHAMGLYRPEPPSSVPVRGGAWPEAVGGGKEAVDGCGVGSPGAAAAVRMRSRTSCPTTSSRLRPGGSGGGPGIRGQHIITTARAG